MECQNPICVSETNSQHSKFCSDCSINHHYKKNGYKKITDLGSGTAIGIREDLADGIFNSLAKQGKIIPRNKESLIYLNKKYPEQYPLDSHYTGSGNRGGK